MDISPRLPTTAEKGDLAMLLAKRRYPHDPFLSRDEMEQAVTQVFKAAISVMDGTSAGPKQILVPWNEDQAEPELLTWFNGALEPAPEFWLHFDEPPF